jgi:hypothetical protein
MEGASTSRCVSCVMIASMTRSSREATRGPEGSLTIHASARRGGGSKGSRGELRDQARLRSRGVAKVDSTEFVTSVTCDFGRNRLCGEPSTARSAGLRSERRRKSMETRCQNTCGR